MKFFMLDCKGNYTNTDYCFTDNGPRGTIDDYDLRCGLRVADEYPDGIGETTLKLGDDYPGLELTSFIGNTHSLLIVEKKVADLIHKGRVHSRDYVFLNPIGSVDCLDLQRSTVLRHDDGTIMKIQKFVLSPAKVAGVRHMFRPDEDLNKYIFSETLVNALRANNCTNLVFEELEMAKP